MEKTDCLIIGAGIAGLGVAYRLQKQGKKVLVLEKEAFVGGRMATITVDGIPIDLGAKFLLPSVYKNITQLASEFSIPFRPITANTFAVMKDGKPLFCDGKNVISILQYKGVSLKAKIQLGLCIAYNLIKYRHLDMYHLERAIFLDNKSIYQYFKQSLDQEGFDYLLDPLCTALFSYDTKEISRAFFLSVLSKMMKAEFYSFDGGISRLCLALAKQVSVRCNVSIQSVKREKDHVIVGGEDTKNHKPVRFHAKKVIVAIPGNKILPMLANPTPAEKAFFSHVFYSQATNIHFKGKSMFFDTFSTIWFPEKENRYFVSIVKNFYLSKQSQTNIFELALRQSFVRELKEKNQFTKHQIAKVIAQELGIQDIDIFHITEWEGMCPKVAPGYLHRRYDFLEKTKDEKQLFYCGDYLENPSTEGGLTSGLKIAEKLC